MTSLGPFSDVQFCVLLDLFLVILCLFCIELAFGVFVLYKYGVVFFLFWGAFRSKPKKQHLLFLLFSFKPSISGL